MKYARRYEELVARVAEGASPRRRVDQPDGSGIGRALSYEARAAANLGRARGGAGARAALLRDIPDCRGGARNRPWIRTARQTARGCRARWPTRSRSRTRAHPTPIGRATAREMGELYRKAKGSEAGLGELVLEAYDRNLALVRARAVRMRANDPERAA